MHATTWDIHTTEYGPERVAKSTMPMRFKDDGVQLGRHRVIGMIATGGMGGVYLAEEPDGKRVALKVLDPRLAHHPELVERLALEQRVSARIAHTGVVKVHEFLRNPGGAPYVVMELLDGESLGRLVDASGVLELGAIAAIGAQIAEALGAMHAAGYVHCDVKPDNVVVLHDSSAALGGWPRVKLIDLGVARRAGIASDESTIAGTPTYMAPEQWRGDATGACDIYSLGCMLYELVTGDPPFIGTLPELANLHVAELPERLARIRPWVPASFDWLVSRMLAKDPALRPTCAEVAEVLARLAIAMPPEINDEAIDDEIDKVVISLGAA